MEAQGVLTPCASITIECKMFENFISWRKNIDPLKVQACLHVSYSGQQTEDEMISLIDIAKDYIEDSELRMAISKGNREISSITRGYNISYPVHLREKARQLDFIHGKYISTLNGVERYYYLLMLLTPPKDSLLDCFMQVRHFQFMVSYDKYAIGWENGKELPSYKYRGGLKVYYNKKFDIEMVDISDRPGRSTELEEICFQGGHEYWFGPAIFHLFPKDTLLSFPEAKEIENDIIHIKLFDLQDYWKPFAQEKLRKLRNHLGIDTLYENLHK